MATRSAASASPQRALPAHIMSSPLLVTKRGHTRSSSLENSFLSKNTLGLPPMQPGQSGTLKSRNEQKRVRNKFGSHSNLDDYAPLQLQHAHQQQPQQQQQIKQQQGQHKQGRLRFQNIRQFFEISKPGQATASAKGQKDCALQSLPNAMTQSETSAGLVISTNTNNNNNNNKKLFFQQQQQQQQPQIRPAPTKHATGSVQRSSVAIDHSTISSDQQQKQQQQKQQQQQQHQYHLQALQIQQQQQQQSQNHQEQVNGIGSTHNLRHTANETPQEQSAASNILRPIAFKPIPFEPDYSIPNRYCEPHLTAAPTIGSRFGSTPSLAPVQGSNLRFGSTTDLRNGNNINATNTNIMSTLTNNATNTNTNSGSRSLGVVGQNLNIGVGTFAGLSSSNYCNSLMARRRGSRSLKINDSMESIRHTPDSDTQSQSSTIKSNCSAISNSKSQSKTNNCNNGLSGNSHSNSNNININSNSSSSSGNSNGNSKFMLSKQCDMTPSPSDSGISDLEAALKDRDSELSYLRQTMEHNEKDKEAFWEKETQRVKAFYDEQQREYLLKIKKMEQMLAMQQFQFKQHKLKHTEQANNLREQLSDLKNENEILRCSNTSLKSSERNLKDRVAYIEEQLNGTRQALGNLKLQLEDCEWKVCERNGEIALLKTQLKEATVEITLKEHAIVHLKNENTQNQGYPNDAQDEQQSKMLENIDEKMSTQNELKQLNKIIILKDQVILALTNELAKLRKELSDLAISHEYGEEPSGKFTRLRQQLDSLTDLCNKKRLQHSTALTPTTTLPKTIDDSNLEVIMNCLKIAPVELGNEHNDRTDQENADERRHNERIKNAEKKLAEMSADIQKFVYGTTQNLPDVAMSITKSKLDNRSSDKLEETTLDTLIEESANYAQEIAKLRHQLDNVRINFESEKRQWCEEREKVLRYQKQLQMHYISMYQKLRSLESSIE